MQAGSKSHAVEFSHKSVLKRSVAYQVRSQLLEVLFVESYLEEAAARVGVQHGFATPHGDSGVRVQLSAHGKLLVAEIVESDLAALVFD